MTIDGAKPGHTYYRKVHRPSGALFQSDMIMAKEANNAHVIGRIIAFFHQGDEEDIREAQTQGCKGFILYRPYKFEGEEEDPEPAEISLNAEITKFEGLGSTSPLPPHFYTTHLSARLHHHIMGRNRLSLIVWIIKQCSLHTKKKNMSTNNFVMKATTCVHLV